MRYHINKFIVNVSSGEVYEFKYLQNSTDVTSYTISGLTPDQEYVITFIASDRNNKEIYFTETITVITKKE